jgi:hypothetical protein
MREKLQNFAKAAILAITQENCSTPLAASETAVAIEVLRPQATPFPLIAVPSVPIEALH